MRHLLPVLIAATISLSGCGGFVSPAPPPDGFAFAALGDAPYYWWEENQFLRVLQQLDDSELALVLHVGDIFWRPCSDGMMQRRRAQFDALRHPLVYTPGDNEWADCWEPRVGGFRPRERLDRLRQIYFAEPAASLGARPIPLTSQGGRGNYPEFVENARWWHDGVLFMTVHLVGSRNFREPFAGRSASDDAESVRRTLAAAQWMRESFAEAAEAEARAVVVAFHANPGLEEPPDDPYRMAFEPFLQAFEAEVESFARPVLAVHGDDHEYTVDQPLRSRASGQALDNLTRLQVPGSPDVGWVHVSVAPGSPQPFSFEPYRIPDWMIW